MKPFLPLMMSSIMLTSLPVTAQKYISKAAGFSLELPAGVSAESTFSKDALLTSKWSALAPIENADQKTGEENLLNVVLADVKTPTYSYLEVLRIARSSNPDDVKNCYKRASCINLWCQMSNKMINGVNYHRFPISDAGMSKYLEGVSYRLKRGNQCYAIESVCTGFNQSDGKALATLKKENQAKALKIIESLSWQN